MPRKVFYVFQRASLIGYEKTHGFADGKYIAHVISPLLHLL
jgi:hypothetical protein